jgi:hypothetical protein
MRRRGDLSIRCARQESNCDLQQIISEDFLGDKHRNSTFGTDSAE